jgi:hypothetical protein
MLVGTYGFTAARLISFNDGMGDYSGNYIPYSPQHTAHLFVSAAYEVGKKGLQSIALSLKADGMGRIYWTRENDISQPFYALLDARLTLRHSDLELSLWGNNLTSTHYNAFSFVTRGQVFAQQGTPTQIGADIRIKF